MHLQIAACSAKFMVCTYTFMNIYTVALHTLYLSMSNWEFSGEFLCMSMKPCHMWDAMNIVEMLAYKLGPKCGKHSMCIASI